MKTAVAITIFTLVAKRSKKKLCVIEWKKSHFELQNFFHAVTLWVTITR